MLNRRSITELDDEAKRIIQTARQRNVSQSSRSPRDHLQIISDFRITQRRSAKDGVVLELGPGQYLLPRILELDSSQYLAIDSDPAVVALGTHLGYRTLHADLKKIDFTTIEVGVAALFCKFAYNIFWFNEASVLRQSLTAILGRLDQDGWGWFCPWNGGAALHDWPEKLQFAYQQTMDDCFEEFGWEKRILTPNEIRRYGLGSSIPQIVVYHKGLLI